MKKWMSLLLCAVMIISLFSGCCLKHEWQEATCEEPKTCNKCGETEGEALGHDPVPADCETPETCARCGKATDSALGHQWQDATCDTPQTCSRCAQTQGYVADHAAGEPAVLETDLVAGETVYEVTCQLCGESLEVYREPIQSPIYDGYFWMTPEQFTVRLGNVLAEYEYEFGLTSELYVNTGDLEGVITCDLTDSDGVLFAYDYFLKNGQDLLEGQWEYDEHCMYISVDTDDFDAVLEASVFVIVTAMAIDPSLDLESAADLIERATGEDVYAEHNGLCYAFTIHETEPDLLVFSVWIDK